MDGTRSVDFSALQNVFASYIKEGGRILDLGCGSGRDSKAFLEKGYEVVAVDGSQELCKLASEYIGQPVICTTFQEYEPEGLFDGIWACASLLHLRLDEVKVVIKKMAAALKEDGVLYVSFKYGTFSGERNGRFFTDMDEGSFNRMLQDIPELVIVREYITEDVRPSRETEKWLNVFLKRGQGAKMKRGIRFSRQYRCPVTELP